MGGNKRERAREGEGGRRREREKKQRTIKVHRGINIFDIKSIP